MLINKDDNILFKNLIHYNLSYKKGYYPSIEIIVRPECNQQCKYCYLVQYGKELYPKRIDKKEIINNFQLFINYLIEQKYIIADIDLFAGDMFYDNLFFDLMPILEQYYVFLNKNYHTILWEEKFNIMIPCNMSFCADEEKIQKVKQIHNEFLNNYHVKIFFSYSTDGIYSTNVREQKELNESYFDTIFSLCEEMGWGIHSMISYEGIDNAIDNYNWFKRKLSQFTVKNNSSIPYFLEVRNDGWTSETLKKYKEFLIYFLNDMFHNECNSNLDIFFNNFFSDYNYVKGKYIYKKKLITNLGNLHFRKHLGHSLGCSISSCDLILNLSNLSIVPCHRLSYPELTGGYFIVENNKIVDICPSEQINTYLSLKYYNCSVSPKCISCMYNPVCMKGCLGAQYEIFGTPTVPISSVCSMFQIKYNTLIEYFHSIGLFHYIFKTYPTYPDNLDLQLLLINLNYIEYKKYINGEE